MAKTGCRCYCNNGNSYFNCNPSAGNGCQACCNSAVSTGGYWACDNVVGKDGGNGSSVLSSNNNRMTKNRKEKYSNFGGQLWKTAKWGLIAIIVLAVVGKGIKVYKEAKSV